MNPQRRFWLLRHDLRLQWREMAGKRFWWMLLGALAIWLVLHIAALQLLRPGGVLDRIPMLGLFRTQILGAVWWTLMLVLLSQAVSITVVKLFERSDLDLLLSSPLSPRALFRQRGIAIATGLLVLPAFLFLPLAHASLWWGNARGLALYPLLLANSLLCAALGLLLTLGLVRVFGVRRARVYAQVAGALIGASVFLLSQLPRLLSPDIQQAWMQWLARQLGPGGWLAWDSALWWPARAAQGELLPLLGFVLGSGLIFTAAIRFTWRRFLSGNLEAPDAGRAASVRVRSGPQHFRGGTMQLLLWKEWKLILRDPHVLSQTLLQLLFLVPMLLLSMRDGAGGRSYLQLPALVLMSGMLAGNLAWLAVAAEDAPDLLASSPLARWRLSVAKLLAATLPPTLLLLPLALYWMPTQTIQAFALLLCAVGAALGAATSHALNPSRGDRRNLQTRYKQSRINSIVEIFSVGGWSVAAPMMASGKLLQWLPLPLALAALSPVLAWWMGRSKRRELPD